MTELEKKQSGEFYDTRDAQICTAHNRAKELIQRYNGIPASDTEQKENLLRAMLGSFGKNCRVNQPFYIDYGTNIFLGDNAFINLNCTLLDTGVITIGENTLLGSDVKIYTAVHETKWTERFWFRGDEAAAIKTRTEPVHIGKYVWIGGGTVILPGVTIGDYAVIGAGSVVTRSIPEKAVAFGNPCRVHHYLETVAEMEDGKSG